MATAALALVSPAMSASPDPVARLPVGRLVWLPYGETITQEAALLYTRLHYTTLPFTSGRTGLSKAFF